jgi:hypothetical protein
MEGSVRLLETPLDCCQRDCKGGIGEAVIILNGTHICNTCFLEKRRITSCIACGKKCVSATASYDPRYVMCLECDEKVITHIKETYDMCLDIQNKQKKQKLTELINK